MMSKKQWFVLLCLFIIYLLLGAGIFFNIETQAEEKRLEEQRKERGKIESLLEEIVNKSTPLLKEREIFKNLSDYCGKPILRGMRDLEDDRKWDFYHSLFFVITVVSTIGYGNLAPTTMFTRIFMIFYGLIGIPMNGIIMVTLGNYFSKSFTKLYRRWKTSKMKYDTTRLGLISQVILYLVPGFTFFIFLPSGIMVLFEGWAYDVAVYYCFVTLTTIGFGDYVAGVDNANNFTYFSFWVYKIFLLIWVIGGLGYVVMILGYITQAMQSKKMQEIEQIITQNIKKTPIRIRQELRTLLQEFLFLKVKPVYKGEFAYIPNTTLERSQSCPDLSLYSDNSPSEARQRAFSECPHSFIFQRIQSETELDRIDKDLTFQPSDNFMQQKDLIQKVVDALGNLENDEELLQGAYHGFSDSQILASERYGSRLSLRSQHLTVPAAAASPMPEQRRRAISDIRVPSMIKIDPDPWSGRDFDNLKRTRTFSEPSSENTDKGSQNFLTKIKNKFMSNKDDKLDSVEKQNLHQNQNRRASMFTTAEDRYVRRTSRGRPSVMSLEQQEAVLEQTSIADFIRALSAITVPETMLPGQSSAPKRKMGNAGLSPPTTSPQRTRRQAIRPNLQVRRTSLMPETPFVPPNVERRRFSLRPVDENHLVPPPPYTPTPTTTTAREDVDRPVLTRRFSRINVPTISISPVARQVNKRENKDDSSTT